MNVVLSLQMLPIVAEFGCTDSGVSCASDVSCRSGTSCESHESQGKGTEELLY